MAIDLAQQLLSQWAQINPQYLQSTLKQSGMTAEQLAKQFADQARAAGITDLGQLKLGTRTEQVTGPEATTDWGSPGTYDVTRNYLTFGEGDQAKNIGYIGAGNQQQYLDDPDALNRAMYGYAFKDQPSTLGRLFGTAEGGGWTAGEVVQGPDGKLMIVPKWGESSDKDELLKAAQMMLTVAPGAAAGLGTLGKAALSGTLAELGGGNFLTGALTSVGGSLLTPSLGGLGESAAKALDASGAAADFIKNAVTGAGTSALGAAATGSSIGDALLTGALSGGATGALKSSVGDLGLPPSVTNVLGPAATAALLGKDVSTATKNAIISELMRSAKTSNIKTMEGLPEWNPEALEPLELTERVTADALLRELGLEAAPDTSTLDQVLPEGLTDTDLWRLSNDDLFDAGDFGIETGNLEQDFSAVQGRDGAYIQDDAGNVDSFSNTGDWVPISDVGEAPTGGNLEPDYSVEQRDDGVYLRDSGGDVGFFNNQGEFIPVDGSDPYLLSRIMDIDPSAISKKGNLEPDYVVEQNKDGAIIRDDAGNRGYFDEGGNWNVVTGEDPKELEKIMTSDTDNGPGSETKTPGTKTGATGKDTPESGLDMNTLLALLGLLGSQQQEQRPQYQLADVSRGVEQAQELINSMFGGKA